MADLGLDEYCLPAGAIDLEALKARFTEAEARRDDIVPALEKTVAERSQAAQEQFTELSRSLLRR
jgi:hypothetical protein